MQGGPGKEATEKEIILPSFKATKAVIPAEALGSTDPGAMGQEVLYVHFFASVDLVTS